MDEFLLEEDDFYAISIAESIAELMLKKYNPNPKQIVGLGHALYALRRLPNSTKGINCEFGIYYENGTSEFRESKYIDFRILEDTFQIISGGHVHDAQIGGDSYSDPEWVIEIGGYASRKLYILYLEDEIREFLNLGAEINVTDDSEIEWED